MATAEVAGATIVKPAHDTFWGGYSGYFQDPDGHLWEVVWNPQWSDGQTLKSHTNKPGNTRERIYDF